MTSKTSKEDFAIVRYEDRYREQSMEVLRKSFFLHETVCIGTEVNLTPQAQRDLELLCSEVVKEGVSMIAKHVPSDTIVGVSFNVLQTPRKPEVPSYFEQFHDTKCTTDSSRALLQYMIAMDAKVNLFEDYNVSSLLEIMYLSTLPDYAGHGIASQLVEQSVRLAEDLKSGKAFPVSDDELRSFVRPQLVSALFSSRISQRVGEKVGFKFIKEIPHSEFVYKGKTYADRIGPEHPSTQIAVKLI